MKPLRTLFFAALLGCLLAPAARAAPDTTPHDSCATAWDKTADPFKKFFGVSRPATPNYYKFSGTPGADLQLFVEGKPSARHSEIGRIVYPFAGVYDAQCKLLAATPDETYHDGKTKVRFTVPANGVFFANITSCCSLKAGGTELGGYTAQVGPYLPPPNIAGTVTDAQGRPLPFTPVTVFQCPSRGYRLCNEWTDGVYTDEQGRYAFNTNYYDQLGTFQLVVRDWHFFTNAPQRTRAFTLTTDITHDFVLQPMPVTIDSVSWASDSVAQGSTAQATTTLTNHSGAALSLDVWLGVNASSTGKETSEAWYQAGAAGRAAPLRVKLAAGQTLPVPLAFTPPASALSGSSGDLAIYVSKAGEPANTYASYAALAYRITPAGAAELSAGAPVQARRSREQAVRRQAALQQLDRSPARLASLAAAPVTGTVRFEDGSVDPEAFVSLYECPGAGYQLCEWLATYVSTDQDGRFSIPASALTEGSTYQLMFVDYGSSHGLLPLQRSASFTAGAGSVTMDGVLKPWTLSLSNVAWDNPSIPAGSVTQVNFTVTNTSGRDLALDAWLHMNAAPTGSIFDSSDLQIGAAGKPQPLGLKLAAGETTSLSLPVTLPKAGAGSGGVVDLFLSEAGQPTTTYGKAQALYFQVTPQGSTRLLSGAAAQAQRKLEAARQHKALLGARQ